MDRDLKAGTEDNNGAKISLGRHDRFAAGVRLRQPRHLTVGGRAAGKQFL
jgi:hypothetical protein